MTENLEIAKIKEEITSVQSSKDELEEFLLPRSAWNSQLHYFKALFKAKRALDKRGRLNIDSTELRSQSI
jgi:hypothetical protein